MGSLDDLGTLMDVFISADIEGVAGVVSWDQTRESGFEYETARVWMTHEVTAACEGAKAGGAGRIVIADSHGNGQNLKLDLLPHHVEVVRGWPRPLGMMQGLESVPGALVFCLGYHTGASVPGLLNHTVHGGAFWDVRIDGRSVSELDLFACVAGELGSPIALVTGDAAFIENAKAIVPRARAVAVKQAASRISAQTIHPQEACRKIREQAEAALLKSSAFDAMTFDGPITLAIDFKWHHPAETLSYLPMFRRTGAHSVETDCKTAADAARTLEFLTNFKLIP